MQATELTKKDLEQVVAQNFELPNTTEELASLYLELRAKQALLEAKLEKAKQALESVVPAGFKQEVGVFTLSVVKKPKSYDMGEDGLITYCKDEIARLGEIKKERENLKKTLTAPALIANPITKTHDEVTPATVIESSGFTLKVVQA